MTDYDFRNLIRDSFDRGKWEANLHSNKGLFQIRGNSSNKIVGPKMDSSGNIIGDLMAYETAYFYSVADRDQIRFFEILQKENPRAAKEYLLVIAGGLRKWREDIKWLQLALKYLQKKERMLEKEERLIKEDEELNSFTQNIPSVLKRHFPQLFLEQNLHNLDFIRLLEKIELTLRKDKEEEKQLENYLNKKREEMPFLF
ncbi:hypothetical protein JW949_00770 [Candidatus Woesearchaeota archaeon]|nr:hypothetical protein [Candidatus Woesearchaeota archaeon]